MVKPPKRHRQWNSTLPAPSSTLARSGRIKPKKRSAKERARIYGPDEFSSWIRTQMCAVCGYCGLASEQAHAKGGGTGRKDNWTRTLPLCRRRLTHFGPDVIEGCHAELHRIGVKSFEAKHDVNLLALAARTNARWIAASTPTNTES